MSNRLDIPDDLAHLIEKREGDRRQAPAEEADAPEGAAPPQTPPAERDRRSQHNDRRGS